MTQKTWFLPPSFNFLPGGELALGTVIPHPSRPTLSLASLASDHPEIPLPKTQTLVEKSHTHSRDSSRSFGASLFAKILDLASASASFDLSKYRNTSLGTVDLDVITFAGGFNGGSALEKITQLPRVKKHIESGLFGVKRRPVYIISGLLVARDSFEVSGAVGSAKAVSVGASAPLAAGAGVPLEVGGEVSVGGEKARSDGYQTAAGVIFAYRVHVIRTARDGDAEAELFTSRTAFLSGEGEEEEEEEEMECREADGAVMDDDLDVDVEWDEVKVEGDEEESVIVFR
ncbi:hypothetical protein QBC42DRAFT_341575 [Cladorrhinum samala]|uniref:Uncharacterized protein n=1 Tax=Cladorrhinum samala TaxID=585594 RepID=A0AAV9HBM9_9PEZI|nr:hypothetical protein QBC42DRAFT_341575 [Cladorrhinum samala]